MREIKAGEFKAKCLALMDEVAQTGEPLIVTKRGRPVVRLEPIRPSPRTKNLFESLAGTMVQLVDDDELMAPFDDWETNKE